MLDNAIKFTQKGSVTLRGEQFNQKFRISVIDTGIGIDADRKQIIFDAFRQLDNSITREYTGAGLGLYIVSKLLARMDAEIQFESEPGQGSTFSFELPLASEIATTGQEISKQTVHHFKRPVRAVETVPGKSAQQSSATILAIDDEPINLVLLERILASSGFTVKTAPDGISGLELVDQLKPEIILLDIMMPKMDGFETAKNIREKYNRLQLPIIFLTAKEQIEDVVRGFTVGGNDYMVKPFIKEELVARISSLLELRKHRVN